MSTLVNVSKKTCFFSYRVQVNLKMENSSLESLHGTGRLSEITNKMAVFMDLLLAEDDELYSSEIQRPIVSKFGRNWSSTTIRQYDLTRSGWLLEQDRFQ